MAKIEDKRRTSSVLTEDEIVGWYHWLKGHEFEQVPEDGEWQGSLLCCHSWYCKESDMTQWLGNNNRYLFDQNLKKKKCNLHLYLRLYNFFIITETSTSMFSQLVSSVTQSCLTLCNPIDFSRPGFPVHHQLPGLAQTHVHWVDHVIQPCHPLSSSSSPAFYLSQHQGLCQWVS